MGSDEGKLFIGGIAWDTTEDKLIEYFRKFGDVTQAVVMRDKITGRPRGFAFVVFTDPSILDLVLQEKHVIDNRTVDAKRALSREEHLISRPGNSNAGKTSEGGGNFRTRKIFVGGLPPTLTEEGFRQYFESYGHVTDVVVMYDQNTQRPRGFGFISFDSEDAVDGVLHKAFHELNGKLVEVKRALPKDAYPGGGSRGGGYQGYGVANTGSFNSQMDGNRYMQPQSTAASFSPFSGYGGPAYGYGAANNGMGYGGYGGYGIGGYGNASAGFNGSTGTYGNPNVPNAGYVSGPPNALKTQWSNQSLGFGASGYGANAGYGAIGPWNAAGSGSVSAPMGQSPSGATAYGNQGYGYGNYGGSGRSFPNSGGYGTSGGHAANAPNSNAGAGSGSGVTEQEGAGSGYIGGGYGDANGNSAYF
ncbi:heterogeneous nuclear ribonucleoprotein 1-like [Malania oleifera]|uniref:heterogeneous nuclear ribonucleoprotein 1-like n=1 Tax=Malania oleifera TaxID=397392 RepID=UPI0025ADB360|nr:heterogeneous nuclear ribonucleoprotein 1-like [Malania oleifera]